MDTAPTLARWKAHADRCTVGIRVLVTEHDAKALVARAEAEGRSVSAVVRQLIVAANRGARS